jgi:phosphatidylglycerophosphate synthase
VSLEHPRGILEGFQPAVADVPVELPVQARLYDGAVGPQEGRQSDVLPTTTEETSKRTDERVNDIFFGPLERPALQFFCRHMPAWVNPDMLTAIGVVGGLIVAVGYWLTNFNTNFLWLVDFGLALDWFGDSLDGTLARYRKIERFRYGYFVDHTLDTFKQTIICIGLGLSPFVGFNYAMLALVGYLQLGILTYVKTAVTGIFKISYGKIGPTEVRVIVIGANAGFYFSDNPMLHLSFINITLFNLILVGITILLFIYFLVFTLTEAASLNKQDRLTNNFA